MMMIINTSSAHEMNKNLQVSNLILIVQIPHYVRRQDQ